MLIEGDIEKAEEMQRMLKMQSEGEYKFYQMNLYKTLRSRSKNLLEKYKKNIEKLNDKRKMLTI